MKPKLVEPEETQQRANAEEWATFLNSFPLYRGSPPRPLYFKKLGEGEKADLAKRGYAAVSVFELARGAVQDEVNYLLAKAQGIEEGTIFASEAEIELLELEMRANRMLGTRNVVTRVTVNARDRDVKELLASWRSSRHTLRGNSTVVEANSLPPGEKVVPMKGIRLSGKVGKVAQREKGTGKKAK